MSNPEARIRIKNLRLRTFIGIKDEEIRNKQDIVLNIVIRFDAGDAVHSTDIETTLNYRTITKKIIDLVENNRFMLLEKLTHDVLQLVMEHPEVRNAEVEVDKPHALRFADSVSIALSASR
jgi:D-erythro-7,8-dihydroneopterin triphosphate epimerase